MAPVAPPEMESPSIRAALAGEILDILPDNQVVYVDRLGPRILTVPPDPTARLSRQTLKDLIKGNLDGRLGHGTRFSSKRMMQCQEISISTNGHYRVEKMQNNPNSKKSRAFTVKTLDIWTGKPGEVHEGRNIQDLAFYSVGVDFLPSFYSWKDDELERRQSTLDLEIQQGPGLAEQKILKFPKPIADMIDEYKERYEAKMELDALNDPENMLRFMPDILPSDPVWEGVEEYFKWILRLKRKEDPEAPQVYRVVQDELLESQLLLAIPAINSTYRAKIQDENTKKYHEALQTTFRGKSDNLTTKLTMLSFGLPIEPLTVANVKFAGGLEDTPTKSDESIGGQVVEKILWSEKPLEFLDYFNKRSYGYPMIRTQKKKYGEMDAETMEEMLALARERARNPTLIWDECGFPEMDEVEQGLHLRGGAGDPPTSLPRTYWIYTDMGRFLLKVEDSFGAFCNLLQRVLRLKKRGNWALQIDLVPILIDEAGSVAIDPSQQMRHWEWTKATIFDFQPQLYETQLAFAIEAKGLLRIRVRDNPIYPTPLLPADLCEPPLENQSVVNLEVKGVGVAYWVLPLNPQGVNILQETFRNALECLIPGHRHYRVQWVINGTDSRPTLSGQSVLIAEAPSVDLWHATLGALGSLRRVTIHITVLGDKPREVKILIPGFNKMGYFTRLPNNQLMQKNPHIFGAIRNLARQWTAPYRTALRIWPGPQHYEDPENLKYRNRSSMVLPAEEDLEAEENIWLSEFLALTTDAVVVTPSFDSFTVICLTNQTRDDIANEKCASEEIKTIEDVITLDLFRNCVHRLSREFKQENDYISIEQPSSGHKFLISPWMTELEWQTQIYDWLDNNTILYRTHQSWPNFYSREFIDGPLEPVRAKTSNQHLSTTQASPGPTAEPDATANEENIAVTPAIGQEPSKSLGESHSRSGTISPANPVITSPSKSLQKSHSRPGTTSPASPFIMSPSKSLEKSHSRPVTISPSKSLEKSLSRPVTISPASPFIISPSKSLEESLSRPVTISPANPVTTSPSKSLQESPLKAPISPFSNMILRPSKKPSEIQPTSANKLKANPTGKGLPGEMLPTSTLEGYSEYRKKQAIQEVARVEAYSQDGSIHRVGENPQIPMFGPALERNIPVAGRTMPAVYKALSTATENLERDRELGDLRKMVLERLEYCGVCQTALPGGTYNLEAQERHFLEHRNLEAEARNEVRIRTRYERRDCPFEGCDQNFNGMTQDEMILHLQQHIGWDDDDVCPIPDCGMQLSGLFEEQVVVHLIEHINDENTSEFRCPSAGCNDVFSDWTQQRILAHINEHFGQNVRHCPFRGCGLKPASLTPQQDAAHILGHIPVARCPFAACRLVLGGFSEPQRKTHLKVHIGPRRGHNSHECPFEDCPTTLRALSNEKRFEHFSVHMVNNGEIPPWASPQCPFEGCKQQFTESTRAQITQHLQTQHLDKHLKDSQETRCPFCIYEWDGADEEVFRNHFNYNHYPENPAEFMCPYCRHRVTNNERTILRHYQNHVSDIFCPWEGCNHEYGFESTSAARTEHLLTHMRQACQWPDCGHVAPERSTPGATVEERRSHLLWHVRQFCPWPNCSHTFPDNATPRNIEQHLLDDHMLGCQWLNCSHRFRQDDDDKMIKEHYRRHVGRSPGFNANENLPSNLECQWPDCLHEFEQNGTSDDIIEHLRTHLPLICPISSCEYVFSPSATDSQKRAHINTHISMRCPLPECDYIFNETDTDQEKSEHIQTHFQPNESATQPVGDQKCPWLGCDREFDEDRTPGQIAAHFHSHLPIQCPNPDCPQQWEEGAQPNEIRAHIYSHAPQICPFPDCGHIFSLDSTKAEKKEHLRLHFPPSEDCQWPGCEHLWVEQPDNEERIGHMMEHARAHGFQTGIQASGVQVPVSPSQGDIGRGSASSGPPSPNVPVQNALVQNVLVQNATGVDRGSENQDEIPKRLKSAHAGKDFFCPACFFKVSGGNASACRRHRKAPCNVVGHDTWLIGTAADRKLWKAAAATRIVKAGGNAGNDDNTAPKIAANPAVTNPKTPAAAGSGSGSGSISLSVSARTDPNYKSPSAGAPGSGGSDESSGQRKPRRSSRKRRRHGKAGSSGGESGGDDDGDSEGQEAKSPKRKRTN